MSKEFINEVNRMKDLFGYKKGVVISEQSYIHEDDAMVSPIKPGSIKTAINAPEVKAELEASQYLSDESWKSKTLPDISLHGLRKCNMSGYKEQNNMECNQIWDAYYGNFYEESVWKQKYGKDVPVEVKGTKDAYGNEMIPNYTQEEKDDWLKNGKKKMNALMYQVAEIGDPYVRLNTAEKIGAFQTWMDKTYPNWAYSQKYKRNYNVGGNPKNGFGVLGPNTKKAWTTYKKEYLEKNPNLAAPVKTIPLTPQTAAQSGQTAVQSGQTAVQPGQTAVQPGQTTVQPGQAAAQINTPIQSSNLETPESVYNSFYYKGLIQGEPSEDGDNRIRYKGPELDAKQQALLTKAMDDKGYEFARKGRDKRLVYKRK